MKRAIDAYKNASCMTMRDFQEDYRRAASIKRVLNEKSVKGKTDINVRLALTHVRTLFNVFEHDFAVEHVMTSVGPENKAMANSIMNKIGVRDETVPLDPEICALISKEVGEQRW